MNLVEMGTCVGRMIVGPALLSSASCSSVFSGSIHVHPSAPRLAPRYPRYVNLATVADQVAVQGAEAAKVNEFFQDFVCLFIPIGQDLGPCLLSHT